MHVLIVITVQIRSVIEAGGVSLKVRRISRIGYE